MYSFKNDYSEGAHPRIMQLLVETNMEQAEGYGTDVFTEEATAAICRLMEREDAHIHLIPGGTQTNIIALSAFLRPHEALMSAHTGHVLVHEAGAIEATGHKVIAIPSSDGKLTPELIEPYFRTHTDEHMVKPRLVYISNSTEVGTHYTRFELEALRAYCDMNGLLLYMDGARLGSALVADEGNLKLKDLGRLMDAYYMGGTKNGALIGEALVILNENLKNDFRYMIKQRGGLLAKGRLLGIQFAALFKDGLYFEIASHANDMAIILTEGLRKQGYSFLFDSKTNQIFPILPNGLIEILQERYEFYVWQPIDDESSAVRLVTSWATDESAIREFLYDADVL